MKSIITSVSPYLCGKIASGDCKILVKKSAPKEVPFKAYIYATRPKKFYKCGAVSTGDELLWLANGKVEMGDGFKFWADGDEYQCLNGRIIGEFICDRIEDFYCASVPYLKENNLGYGQFVDNGVYKVNGWHEGIIFERNDNYIETMLNNDDLKEMCLSAQELFDYIGVGKHLYAWHISDLKIYDKPRELREFYYCCKEMKANEPRAGKYVSLSCYACRHNALKRTEDYSEYNNMLGYICKRNITRPPQSYMFVEEVETR